MVTSTSRFSYGDCFDIFEAAMGDPNGVRLLCKDKGDANQLRVRLHAARSIDRKDNLKTFEPTDAMYGRSPYDGLAVRLKQVDERFYLYVEKIQLDREIEPLSQLGEEPKLNGPEAPKRITNRRF